MIEKKIDSIMKTLGIMVDHHRTEVLDDGPNHTIIQCRLCAQSDSFNKTDGVPKWVTQPCKWWLD